VAEKLSFDPLTVGPEDWASLREVGLDDEGCLEVAHIVGVFNHLTRLADGFGLRVDPTTLAAASGGPPLRRPVQTR
jgi:alkylhydroperoxidase family enzyme